MFRIPFNIQPEDRPRIQEVQLWVSTDLGLSWAQGGRASADQPSFTFHADHDGEYWFAVRTLDIKGKLYPTDDAKVEPSIKVVVDTAAPSLVLTPMERRGSLASLQWEMRDEYLDPDSLVLEYQLVGARDWRQVQIRDRAINGVEQWDAHTAGPIKVRAWVDDKAGNRATGEVLLPEGIAARPEVSAIGAEEFEPPPPIAPLAAMPSGARSGSAPAEQFSAGLEPRAEPGYGTAGTGRAPQGRFSDGSPPQTLLVGSPRFALKYDIEDAGPNGPALVELWVTRDGGRTWARQPEDADRVTPYPVDLGGDGTYGLWLVVQSAAHLGDLPPQPGDRPRIWVEVDSAAPVVRLEPPRVGIGRSVGKVLITWHATDAHLGDRPVTLSYRADHSDAPWQPIAEPQPNTGRFIWNVPANVPPRFHLRIEVVDAMGNRGWAETTDSGRPVIVDRSQPRGRITGIDLGTPGSERARQ